MVTLGLPMVHSGPAGRTGHNSAIDDPHKQFLGSPSLSTHWWLRTLQLSGPVAHIGDQLHFFRSQFTQPVSLLRMRMVARSMPSYHREQVLSWQPTANAPFYWSFCPLRHLWHTASVRTQPSIEGKVAITECHQYKPSGKSAADDRSQAATIDRLRANT